jgi:hypothetical protein
MGKVLKILFFSKSKGADDPYISNAGQKMGKWIFT